MNTKLTLSIVDLAADAPQIVVEALRTAAAVRPLDHNWRDKAAAILRYVFPESSWIYRGGHHVALHSAGPMQFGTMESTPCVARIIEARERKEAA